MIQSASDGENRANANVQRLNQELANADQKISSLEESPWQSQSLNRGIPSRLSPIGSITSPSSQLSSVQMAELNSLRDQNKKITGAISKLIQFCWKR